MSLTSLIKTNAEVKVFLLRTMPRKETFVSNTDLPAFSTKNVCTVPKSEESRSAQIGMLTDFLFRFVTAKTAQIPVSYSVAQAGIAVLQNLSQFYEPRDYNQAVRYCSLAIVAQTNFEKYKAILDAEDTFNKETAPAILSMARMEQLAHGAMIKENFFLDVNKREMEESLQMLQLYYNTILKSDIIHHDSDVVLSPGFGAWGEESAGQQEICLQTECCTILNRISALAISSRM